ncbi:MAG: TetR/AcrR family transcriptional regulator [Sphaerospermopsis sp.]|nr:TetR/AcrR family transcriptional regulator [Sphaerospermopsis sp.]
MPKQPDQTSAKAEQILQGAMQEFLKGGYADTSMVRIASTAKVSKETLYNYFANKEALFAAIVERIAKQQFEDVFASEPLPADPAECLRKLAPKSLTAENLDPTRMNFYRLIVAESGRFPDLARLYIKEFEKPNLAASTEYLQNCQELRSSDPEAVAWIIAGTINFYYLMMELLHGKHELTMTSDRLTEALIELLFPKSDRQ